MHIVIKEINGFMPTTTIRISEDKIEVEENNNIRILKYDRLDIKKIMHMFLEMSKGWKNKYIDNNAIIDDEVYDIVVVSNNTKKYYMKNKYPDNFSKFILFRNHLVREELKVF